MADLPQYAATPVIAMVQISAANATRDGSNPLVDVVTGSSHGTRIDAIELQAVGNTTAGMIRLFLNSGSATRLFAEIPVTALVPSGTALAWSQTLTTADTAFLPIVLPSGWIIRASTHNAETFNVIAFGGDF